MGLFQVMMRRVNPEVVLPDLANQIADRSTDAVWQRVKDRIGTLSRAEARGYVRARGAVVLRSKFQAIADKNGVVGGRRAQLFALATESLIQRIQARARAANEQQMVRWAA